MPNLTKCHVFLLDNFDSFTYNLVDQFRSMGADVTIYRNDIDKELIIEKMKQSELPPVLVLSPGPGSPAQAGCLVPLVKSCINRFPILGICLGHQAIIEAYGGTIGLSPETVHGKASHITHNGQGPFLQLLNPMPVARYHSLMATKLPQSLEVIATTEDIVMSVTNKEQTLLGFQFHPESILTPDGEQLLAQSLNHLLANKEALT